MSDMFTREEKERIAGSLAVLASEGNIKIPCGRIYKFLYIARNSYGVGEMAQTGKGIPDECLCGAYRELSKSKSGYVRQKLSENKSIPEKCACDVFSRLAKDEGNLIQSEVGRNTKLPKECACDVLRELSHDKDEYVRYSVAINKNLPDECVCELYDILKDDKGRMHSASEIRENKSVPDKCKK